jgi:hypothetical protein
MRVLFVTDLEEHTDCVPNDVTLGVLRTVLKRCKNKPQYTTSHSLLSF